MYGVFYSRGLFLIFVKFIFILRFGNFRVNDLVYDDENFLIRIYKDFV